MSNRNVGIKVLNSLKVILIFEAIILHKRDICLFFMIYITSKWCKELKDCIKYVSLMF